jgi:hypothetical protein
MCRFYISKGEDKCLTQILRAVRLLVYNLNKGSKCQNKIIE